MFIHLLFTWHYPLSLDLSRLHQKMVGPLCWNVFNLIKRKKRETPDVIQPTGRPDKYYTPKLQSKNEAPDGLLQVLQRFPRRVHKTAYIMIMRTAHAVDH